MQRRVFLLAPLAAALTACGGGDDGDGHDEIVSDPMAEPPATPADSQPALLADGTIDVVAEIKSLRIPTGPYAGGYELAPNGRLNWYFAALGLLPIVRRLSAGDLDVYVRSYLDLYLRSLNPNLSIDDIDFPAGRANTSGCVKVPSDSDDSYAATFLSLAAKYMKVSGDRAWWDANKARIKDLAYRNIALSLKPNGLTSVFQAPRNSSNSIGYLMDNCEVYRGLRDFAEALAGTGEGSDAAYYGALADNVGAGIRRLFAATPNAFMAGDANLAPETSFYTGTTCQVFPQAFGVSECASYFDAGWNFLNLHTPGWEDGRYDTYPWAILGFVAARRGQFTQARAQKSYIERLFAASRQLVTINELGFYQRTATFLAGAAES